MELNIADMVKMRFCVVGVNLFVHHFLMGYVKYGAVVVVEDGLPFFFCLHTVKIHLVTTDVVRIRTMPYTEIKANHIWMYFDIY